MKKAQLIVACSAFVLAIGSAFTLKPKAAFENDKQGFFKPDPNLPCQDAGVLCSTTGSIRCTTGVLGVNKLFQLLPNATCTIPLFSDPD